MNHCLASQSGYFVVTICFPHGGSIVDVEDEVRSWNYDYIIILILDHSIHLVQCLTEDSKAKFLKFCADASSIVQSSENQHEEKCLVLDSQSEEEITIEKEKKKCLDKLFDDLPYNNKHAITYKDSCQCLPLVTKELTKQQVSFSKFCPSFYVCIPREEKKCNKCTTAETESLLDDEERGVDNDIMSSDSVSESGTVVSVSKGKQIAMNCHLAFKSLSGQGQSYDFPRKEVECLDDTQQNHGSVGDSQSLKSEHQQQYSMYNIEGEKSEKNRSHVTCQENHQKGEIQSVMHGQIYLEDADAEEVDTLETERVTEVGNFGIVKRMTENDILSDQENIEQKEDAVATVDISADKMKSKNREVKVFYVETDVKPSFPEHSSHPMHTLSCMSYMSKKQKKRLQHRFHQEFVVYSGRRRPGARRRNQIREAMRMQQSDEYSRNLPFEDPNQSERQTLENVVTSTVSIFNRFKDRNSIPTTSVSPSLPYEEMQNSRILGVNPCLRHFGRPSARPKYPQYTTVGSRRDTFFNWPETAQLTVDDMITGGFFYSGRDDLVRCYHCGIGLRDWSAGDIPLLEHVRHAHNCTFLADTLEPEILAEYMAELNIGFGTANAVRQLPADGPPTEHPPRNPFYATHQARVASYDQINWPVAVQQTPEQLSDAGFFFTGIEDLCRCFQCDGGLQNWRPEDDPWREHARSFPACRFVADAKGQTFIAEARQPRQTDVLAAQALDQVSDATTQAEVAAREAGFTEEAIRRAARALQDLGNHTYTAEELLNYLLGQGE